jgi:hypothetical protein
MATLAVVVVPAYRNETVVEAFPVSLAPDDVDTIVPAPSSSPTTPTTSPALSSVPAGDQDMAPSSTAPSTSSEPTTTTTAQTEPMLLRAVRSAAGCEGR